MQAFSDRQSLWLMGSKDEVLERLNLLCRLYGQNTPLVELLRLLQQ